MGCSSLVHATEDTTCPAAAEPCNDVPEVSTHAAPPSIAVEVQNRSPCARPLHGHSSHSPAPDGPRLETASRIRRHSAKVRTSQNYLELFDIVAISASRGRQLAFVVDRPDMGLEVMSLQEYLDENVGSDGAFAGLLGNGLVEVLALVRAGYGLPELGSIAELNHWVPAVTIPTDVCDADVRENVNAHNASVVRALVNATSKAHQSLDLRDEMKNQILADCIAEIHVKRGAWARLCERMLRLRLQLVEVPAQGDCGIFSFAVFDGYVEPDVTSVSFRGAELVRKARSELADFQVSVADNELWQRWFEFCVGPDVRGLERTEVSPRAGPASAPSSQKRSVSGPSQLTPFAPERAAESPLTPCPSQPPVGCPVSEREPEMVAEPPTDPGNEPGSCEALLATTPTKKRAGLPLQDASVMVDGRKCTPAKKARRPESPVSRARRRCGTAGLTYFAWQTHHHGVWKAAERCPYIKPPEDAFLPRLMGAAEGEALTGILF